MAEPELENWSEIQTLLNSEVTKNNQLGFGKAMQNITIAIVNSRLALFDLKKTMTRIVDGIELLNVNLKKADESSTKLTEALNKITKYGVIVAGAGVLVALFSLLLEIYKTFFV